MLFSRERNLNAHREFNSRVRRELKLSLLVSITREKGCVVRRLWTAEGGLQVQQHPRLERKSVHNRVGLMTNPGDLSILLRGIHGSKQ